MSADVSQVLEIALEPPEEETAEDSLETGNHKTGDPDPISHEAGGQEIVDREMNDQKPGNSKKDMNRKEAAPANRTDHWTGPESVKILALSTAEPGCSLAVMDNGPGWCAKASGTAV